jgi:hypothetical protein
MAVADNKELLEWAPAGIKGPTATVSDRPVLSPLPRTRMEIVVDVVRGGLGQQRASE